MQTFERKLASQNSEGSSVPKLKRIRNTLLSSALVWLLLILAAADFFFLSVRPLQYVRIKGLVTADQEPLDDKLDRLYSGLNKPELLILGSSLPMVACVGADWEMQGRPAWSKSFCERYSGSSYFDSLLSALLNKKLTGANLGMPACMISDDLLILKDVLAKGVRPRVLFLAVAPRDFIDNAAEPADASRYFRFFKSRRLELNLSFAKSLEENVDELLNRCWRYFKIRSDYKNTVEFIVCSLLGRASTISYAISGKSFSKDRLNDLSFDFNTQKLSDTGPPADIENSLDMKVYRSRYLPFNQKRLASELASLEQLLRLCRKYDILPVVLNMPLHPANIALLSTADRRMLNSEISKVCSGQSAKYVDLLGSSKFLPADFSDSVHLRASASKKLFDELVLELKSDKNFLKQLKSNLPN